MLDEVVHALGNHKTSEIRHLQKTKNTTIQESTFIHSFILAISIAPLQVLYHSEVLPTTARILYRSFTPKCTGIITAGKGLAQGPYVTARAGVEPTTLRLKVIDSTKAPSRPNKYSSRIASTSYIELCCIVFEYLYSAPPQPWANKIRGCCYACRP